ANGRSGAAVGAMLFASQAAFADIYWNFGSIFDLACAFGFFAGVLWWMNENRTWKTILGCTLVFLFALKAKEMAITLPAVWLLCDLLLRKRKLITATSNGVLPAAVGLWYGRRKFEQMGQSLPTGLYYMDVRWITLGRSLGVFFNSV